MSEELKPNPNEVADNQEAHLAADNMAEGTEKTATVDADADYEASKEMSVSDVDKSGQGSAAAEAATATQEKVSQSSIGTSDEVATGDKSDANPEDYREMAKETNPRA